MSPPRHDQTAKRSVRPLTRTKPTIEDMRVFCLLHEHRNSPSFNTIARKIGNVLGTQFSTSSLLQRLDLLKKHFHGRDLVTRTDAGGFKGVSDVGETLYERFARLVSTYDAALEAPATRPVISIGVTNAIMVFMMPAVLRRYAAAASVSRQLEHLRFEEGEHDDLMAKVAAGHLDFAIGPYDVPTNPNVQVTQIDVGAPVLFICPATHRLAARIAAAQGDSEIQIEDLECERLFLLKSHLQPDLLEILPRELRRATAERIELSSYTSILASVEAGLGGGLLLGWQQVISDLRQRRKVYAAEVKGVSHTYAGVYTLSKMSTSASQTLHWIKEHMRHEFGRPDAAHGGRRHRRPQFPENLNRHTLLYSIHCRDDENAAAEWRLSNLDYSKCRKRELQATQYCFADARIQSTYDVDGMRSSSRLVLSGINCCDRNDRYSAVFSACLTDDILVGTMHSLDSYGRPLVTSAVLSSMRLTRRQLNDCVRQADTGFVADTEFGPFLGADPDSLIADTRSSRRRRVRESPDCIPIDVSAVYSDELHVSRIELTEWRPDRNVQEFVDDIYHMIDEYVADYTYGTEWLLYDSVSGRDLSDLGSAWARKNDRLIDTRTVREVSITRKMQLAVRLLPNT